MVAIKAGRTQMLRENGNYPATVNEDGLPPQFKRVAAENDFTADDVNQLLFTQVSKPSIVIAAATMRRTHGKMPHHNGEIRLYRLILHPNGTRRRNRTWQGQKE
jgi:hypothetical protein